MISGVESRELKSTTRESNDVGVMSEIRAANSVASSGGGFSLPDKHRGIPVLKIPWSCRRTQQAGNSRSCHARVRTTY